MKKILSTILMLLLATFMSLSAQTAQQVAVTTSDGIITTYDLSSLPSLIEGATAVTLTGDDWTEDNLGTFGDAIAGSASTLLSVDMETITLSGAFISNNKGFYKLFNSFSSLESVTLPSSGTASKVTFQYAFSGSSKLVEVNNLDKFSNVSCFSATFYNCSSLTEVRLGTDPNNVLTISSAFYGTNTNCIKYLPSGVTDVPSSWQEYGNFAVPITGITIDDQIEIYVEDTIVVYLPTISPSYAASQNGAWEFKKVGDVDWSEYTIGSKLDVSYDGADLRYKAQSYELDNDNQDDVYSNISTISSTLEPLTKQVIITDASGAIITYNLLSLPTSISGATVVALTGEYWTEDDLNIFGNAIHSSTSTLESVDMGAITLNGDFTTSYKGFYYLFYNHTSLETITLPEGSTASEVTFCGAFCGCSNLTTIENLDKFSNVSDFFYAFRDCSSLTEVRLGTDPNNVSSISYAFDGTNTNCIKYLPSGVTEVPSNWQDYGNFAVPITIAIYDQIEIYVEDTLIVYQPGISPFYAARKNAVWEFKKVGDVDWSEYTTGSKLDASYDGAELRYKAQPYELDNDNPDYVYSNISTISSTSEPQTKQVIITDASGAIITYDLLSLPTSISGATVVALTGEYWTEDDIDIFGDAIGGSIYTLESVDMEAITLSGDFTTSDKGFYGLFRNYTVLESVILPSVGTASEITFDNAFVYCSRLTTILNLEKFTNISSCVATFVSCSSLESLILPKGSSIAAISFNSAFAECVNLSTIINLEEFIDVSDFSFAFLCCSSLETITLPEGSTASEVTFCCAFYGCSNLTTIENLDKFSNVSDFSYAFRDCSSLTEVRLGTNPNNVSSISSAFYGTNAYCVKYLPSGVTEVPSDWQEYGNFAVPITALSDITAPDATYAGEALKLPTASSITPTYAASQNPRWEIRKSVETDWSEYTSGTTLDYSYNGALLRYSVQPYDVDTDTPDAVTSNEVVITVKPVISYDANGGEGTMSTEPITLGTEVILTANEFTRSEYSFVGWSTTANGAVEYMDGATYSVVGSLTLYAQWSAVEYGITYNLDGGTNDSANPSTYTIETATITLADATRTGYSFAGWYDAETGGTKVTEIATGSTGAVVLYAQWSAVDYGITYNLSGGTNATTNPATYTIETAAITLADATRTGYSFAGWYDAATGGNKVTEIANGSTGAVVLYAQWSAVEYGITYNLNGGTNATTNPTTYTIETATITLADATRTGYSFAGWYDATTGGTKVTEITNGSTGAVVLYAQWSAVEYGITYILGDGANAATNPSVYTIETATITLADATRTGYSFAGWYDAATGGNKVTEIANGSTGAVVLYAQWSTVAYGITYNLNGGTNDATNPSVYTIETATITLSDATRTGYSFNGWYDAETGGNKVTEIANGSTGAVVLYAQWSAVEYGITYNLSGGTNAATNPSTYTIETATITLADATRTGYSFVGWYDAATDGNRVTEIVNGSTGAVVLYAQWAINSYSVTASATTGGTATVNGTAIATVEYGDDAEFVAVADEGYTFTNWTDADGVVVSEVSTYTVTITEDLSLTANFTKSVVTEANTVIENNIIVTANRNIITIHGAEIGATAMVFSTSGALIYNGVITSDAQAISLMVEGVYIVKVNDYITKTVVNY